MALIQLSYVSIAAAGLMDADLDQIVESATRKNAENDITGMLLYAEGRFMQLLEGEEQAVLETFARVSLDPRHYDAHITERSPIAARSFANWSMGFKRMASADLNTISTALPPTSNAPDGVPLMAPPRLADAILRELARTSP
jgi:hypothetical protein